jgi:group I intron endonuclease
MKTFIYTLTDPRTNQVRYVGKSNKPNKRLSSHLGRTEKNHKYSWLKQLENNGLKPILEIVDEVPSNEWRFWEQYWISQFRAWGFDLTNLTDGGEGFASGELNPAHLPHVKELRSKIHKGKIISQEMKNKISEKLTGRKNPEHSKRMTGRVYSEEHKKAVSVSLRGHRAILNEEQVKEIKTIIANNVNNLTLQNIADMFGVTRSTIKNIKSKRVWGYIVI